MDTQNRAPNFKTNACSIHCICQNTLIHNSVRPRGSVPGDRRNRKEKKKKGCFVMSLARPRHMEIFVYFI